MLKLHCILCVFDHCLSHGELKFNTWAHHNCLNVVPFINLNLFSQKERYVMCICSLSPSLLSPKSIKLNEDSSPIPIKIKSSSSRFRPTKVQFSKFQLKHPQWTKKKQAAQLCLIPQAVKPYFGYQDHCLILKFIVYYMFLMRIFVEVYCFFVDYYVSCILLKKINKKKRNLKKKVFSKI